MGLFSIFAGANINDSVKKYIYGDRARLSWIFVLKMNTEAAIYRKHKSAGSEYRKD